MASAAEAPSLLADVRSFLSGLKASLPELFPPSPKLSARKVLYLGAEKVIEAGDPESWLRREARTLLAAKTGHWGARMGVAPKRIFIKDQRTLWGSCSAQGNINYNWRLVMAPEEISDYVVIHELAHLLEMNHSPRFWAHVAAHCPDHKRRRLWLRQNHRSLKSRFRRPR